MKDFFDFCKNLLDENSFKPNLTSALIAKAAEEEIKRGCAKYILDIGSGNGCIGLYLSIKNPSLDRIVGVESHAPALKNANINAELFGKMHEFYTPEYLHELVSQKPDLIINDVSGISSDIVQYVDWFEEATETADVDGIAASIGIFDIILNAGVKNQAVIFPLISLCNTEKYKRILQENWSMNLIVEKEWPAPKCFYGEGAIKTLRDLNQIGVVSFKEKFGIIIFTTQVWIAHSK